MIQWMECLIPHEPLSKRYDGPDYRYSDNGLKYGVYTCKECGQERSCFCTQLEERHHKDGCSVFRREVAPYIAGGEWPSITTDRQILLDLLTQLDTLATIDIPDLETLRKAIAQTAAAVWKEAGL